MGFIYGYYVQIAGIATSIFNGTPSENTAYFSFRTTEFQVLPLPVNGDINHLVALADTFNVYYDPNPNRDWTNPDSFSTGTAIANWTRTPFLLIRIWESFTTEYIYLNSSQNFTFNNATLNIGAAIYAVTQTNFYSNAPIPALPGGFSDVIAFSGNGIVAANPQPTSVYPIYAVPRGR